MGAMADAALTVGGDVVGMIPEALRRPASSFQQRKGQLQKQSDVLLSVDIVAVGIEIGRDVAVADAELRVEINESDAKALGQRGRRGGLSSPARTD
jgi:hypothetical protein